MMLISTERKQPNERTDYNIDYSQWLRDGDTIADFSLIADDPSLDVDGLIVGKTLNMWVSGGLDGATYKITITVTTAQGRIKEDEFKVKVKEI